MRQQRSHSCGLASPRNEDGVVYEEYGEILYRDVKGMRKSLQIHIHPVFTEKHQWLSVEGASAHPEYS
jgi:hypothetical protein